MALSLPLPGNCKRVTLRINENHIRGKDTKFENLPHLGAYYQNVSLIQLYKPIGWMGERQGNISSAGQRCKMESDESTAHPPPTPSPHTPPLPVWAWRGGLGDCVVGVGDELSTWAYKYSNFRAQPHTDFNACTLWWTIFLNKQTKKKTKTIHIFLCPYSNGKMISIICPLPPSEAFSPREASSATKRPFGLVTGKQ